SLVCSSNSARQRSAGGRKEKGKTMTREHHEETLRNLGVNMTNPEVPSSPTNAQSGPQGPGPEPLEPILQFFAYAHLPPHLGEVSREFHILALTLVNTLPRNPERTVALRKLLEAKDAAVRAKLFKYGET